VQTRPFRAIQLPLGNPTTRLCPGAGALGRRAKSGHPCAGRPATRAGTRSTRRYFAFGDHDAIVLLDLPDNEAAAAAALAVDAAGGATTTTTVLLTPEQVDDAAKRSVEAVDYRPPGT